MVVRILICTNQWEVEVEEGGHQVRREGEGEGEGVEGVHQGGHQGEGEGEEELVLHWEQEEVGVEVGLQNQGEMCRTEGEEGEVQIGLVGLQEELHWQLLQELPPLTSIPSLEMYNTCIYMYIESTMSYYTFCCSGYFPLLVALDLILK